jgi:predicted nucleic acid-binding protein
VVVTTKWLIDKSAFVRLPHSPDRDLWSERISRALVYVVMATKLELGFSARNYEEWHNATELSPTSELIVSLMTPAAEHRALAVQGLLAAVGHHRAPSVPDLLIAAVAETAGLTVLHVDKDFELIAEVTHQPHERLQL